MIDAIEKDKFLDIKGCKNRAKTQLSGLNTPKLIAVTDATTEAITFMTVMPAKIFVD